MNVREWPGLRSVRARLTLAASLVMTVALCIAAGLLVWSVGHSLRGSVDTTARERAREVARLPAVNGVLPTTGEADNIVQIVNATGTPVAGTPNLQGVGRLFTFVPRGGTPVHSVRRVPVPDAADSYRVAVVAAADGRLVYAAVPDDDQRAVLRRLQLAVVGGLPVIIGILVVTTWVLVGRALRPVEVAARRQREFVADAAHELRSPLATLRTQIEVAAAQPDDGLWRETAPMLIAGVDRVARLADDLLQLARLEDGRPLTRRVFDLDDVVFSEVTRLRSVTGVSVDSRGVSAAQVSGDAPAVARLVRNLLDNAARHAERAVTVTLHVVDGMAVLTVGDDGAGVPAGDRVRIFDRFTRLDDARTRTVGGAGLGLAIVRDVANAHGGSVEVADSAVGAVFVVHLPAVRTDVASRRPVARPDARPARSPGQP
ncbi:MAG: sensor histidine kinase [Actinomycetes bacterium]